ncbi:MAG: AzlD domain-containing protein, partial [Archaeoglobaceae archaeon]
YETNTIWLIFIAAGIGTFLLRLSFIFLMGRLSDVPSNIERVLRFVPAAVLTALVVPAIVYMDGSLAIGMENEKLFAGTLAAVVAWRTRNMLATIGIGMLALWSLQAIL